MAAYPINPTRKSKPRTRNSALPVMPDQGLPTGNDTSQQHKRMGAAKYIARRLPSQLKSAGGAASEPPLD